VISMPIKLKFINKVNIFKVIDFKFSVVYPKLFKVLSDPDMAFKNVLDTGPNVRYKFVHCPNP
jgi:hypothetical protein